MYILTNSKPVKMNKDNRFYNKLFLDSINIELTEEEKNLLGEHIYSFDVELLTKIRKEQYKDLKLDDYFDFPYKTE